MKSLIATLLLSIPSLYVAAQNNAWLTEEEVSAQYPIELLSALGVEYPVYRIYEYADNAGDHVLIMTEHPTKCVEMEHCFDEIRAYTFLKNDKTYSLEWQMRDFILDDGNAVSPEHSINFWTKYFELADYDQDGLIDPIVVYGTFGMNGTDDGRIKILVYHMGKKLGVRHQNGTLDFERNTKVDKLFYELPKSIQLRVQDIMQAVMSNDHGIFPYGWQDAMKSKQTYFDEN